MKSLIALLHAVLNDLGTRCDTSTTRDRKTIAWRVEHEGWSFLTITLSSFGSDVQKAIDQGYVAHDQFPGFSRTGGLPRFLGGFLELVFHRDSGLLREVPSVEAIFALRQFTLMWAKILPSSDFTKSRASLERERRAIRSYLTAEAEVRLSDRKLISSESYRFEEFAKVGRLLWADMFSRIDSRIYQEGVVPRHGPGATADKLRGNAKYDQQTWTMRLEEVFPHWENVIPSESFLDRTDGFSLLEPGDEIPVRVITVPKTQKTPRIIAAEPTCMQYMQQGVLAVMVQEFSRFDNARNFVAFESQEPNQRLAREGSITGSLATLDLSEASDRVSYQHVRLLVANHRELRHAIDATRSRKADVPGHGEIRLAKYASMGSALCFPFEALVFATIVFVGIQRELNRPLTEKDVKSFYGRVRVYGDDIIVPVDFVIPVIEELEAFGLRVNRSKSFWTGKFRESCGKDYYDGRDVSITRVRRVLPDRRQDAEEVVSAVSLRNQLYLSGFVEAVDYLDEWIGNIIPFPVIDSLDSPLQGRLAPHPSQVEGWDSDLQSPLVKGVQIVSKLPVSKLDDSGALMKWFLMKQAEKPDDFGFYSSATDRDHLQRAGRAVSVSIKTGWSRPY